MKQELLPDHVLKNAEVIIKNIDTGTTFAPGSFTIFHAIISQARYYL